MCHGDYFVNIYTLFNFEPVKDSSEEVMWEFFGVRVMVRTKAFLMCLMLSFSFHERKSMVKRVTIIKTRVNKGSGDSSSGGKVKSAPNTTEVTNAVMASARKGRNLS